MRILMCVCTAPCFAGARILPAFKVHSPHYSTQGPDASKISGIGLTSPNTDPKLNMEARGLRDSTTLPRRQTRSNAEREEWEALQTDILGGSTVEAFIQVLAILVSSLINPETGIILRRSHVNRFFEPEYNHPVARLLIISLLRRIAKGSPSPVADPNSYHMLRTTWLAFLSPLVSNESEVTAFYIGTTPLSKILPVLDELGLCKDLQEVCAVQHELAPLLGSRVFASFKGPLPVSIGEMQEVIGKVEYLQHAIGPGTVPLAYVIVLAMSHFGDARQVFLQDWAETVDGENLSLAARDQFWGVSSPNTGLVLLLAMLLRAYYVFGGVDTSLRQSRRSPELPADLSHESYLLLIEATASYVMAFDLESLFRVLVPHIAHLKVWLPESRKQAWCDFYGQKLDDRMNRLEARHLRREVDVVRTHGSVWWKLCLGYGRRA